MSESAVMTGASIEERKTKVELEPAIPLLSPRDVAQHGLENYESNMAIRLINAAFHASRAAVGKKHFRPNHVVVRIVGRHGVGKTGMVAEYARNEGLGYYKLDAQVTDIAEVFGMKDTRKYTSGKVETVTAPPDGWPKPGTLGILNIDDMSRALPHVLQPLQQFIMEREFNGLKLPDGWSIVITDNPDDGDYNVSSLDPAQISRMITVPWNPPVDIEFEQLQRQEVHDDLKSFWMANSELVQTKPVDLPAPEFNQNPRMRMIFNRIYPYIKHDPALLDFVGSSMFGSAFVATLKATLADEMPISPSDIFNDVPYVDRLTRWSTSGRSDLISLSVTRLLHDVRQKANDRLSAAEFEKIATFLKKVPVDSGAIFIRAASDTSTNLGNRVGNMLSRDQELQKHYYQHIRNIRDKITAQNEEA